MRISENMFKKERNYPNVFMIAPNTAEGFFEVYSNRKLIWRWIQERKVFVKKATRDLKEIKSYATLCRYWDENFILKVIVLEDQKPNEYLLIKAPVINK